MPTVNNKKGGRALIRATTTETIVVAGAVGVSNVASVGETVISGAINKIWWSGTWTVARGANTLLSLANSGFWDLNGQGAALGEYPEATLVLTGSGSIIVELAKKSNFASDYFKA